MPFFPQAYLSSPEASFFHLLSELDQPQRKTCSPRHSRPAPTFNPKFDVTEVSAAYELYGELPGIEQKDIEIEFTDAQTLVIKGKTERSYNNAASAAESEVTKDAEVEPSSEKSHSPTVEDEYDETDTPLATPATTATATNDAPQEQAETQVPKPKFWVAERKVGEFARSFSFSQRIEQDGVQASLKNGVLRIVVPKSQKPTKVAVSVY